MFDSSNLTLRKVSHLVICRHMCFPHQACPYKSWSRPQRLCRKMSGASVSFRRTSQALASPSRPIQVATGVHYQDNYLQYIVRYRLIPEIWDAPQISESEDRVIRFSVGGTRDLGCVTPPPPPLFNVKENSPDRELPTFGAISCDTETQAPGPYCPDRLWKASSAQFQR